MKAKLDSIANNPKAASSEQIYVGFSGGIDSTALLLILHQSFPRKVHAVHFQHGMRGMSALKDADWCRAFCEKHAISFSQIELEVPKNRLSGESEEECARRLRLEQWKKTAAAPNILIALGHHHDDLIENFFIRLMRGSNSSGLTSLTEYTSFNKMHFWRPLLPFSKQDLQDFLNSEGITDYCTDESNKDPKYRRNSIRHNLIPQFTEIAGNSEGISKSISILQDEANYLNQMAEIKLEALLKDESDLTDWQAIPKALLSRVLRLWHKDKTNQDFVFNHATIERIHHELKRPETFERLVPLYQDTQLIINNAGLHLHDLSEELLLEELVWNWQETPEICWGKHLLLAELIDLSKESMQSDNKSEYFDADKLPSKLKVRGFIPGDRMSLLGSGHHKKLKEIFINKKTCRSERKSIPLIIANEEIIWASGVCRSNFAPLTPETNKVLKLSFKLRN